MRLARPKLCGAFAPPVIRGAPLICRASTTTPHGEPPSVIVVGGGAAGLTAAFFAQQSGARVMVLERMREAGKKILMSGGTRSNVLPAHISMADFFSESPPGALRSMLATWDQAGCYEWLTHQVGLELALETETAKYFPASNSAREVRDKLVAACERQGVVIRYGASLKKLRRAEGGAGGWRCTLDDGDHLEAGRVVVATGGLSFPAVGTDGTGHRVLRELGHTMMPTYPALTPLTGVHPGGENLAGISMPVQAQMVSGKKKRKVAAERGGFLFTHRGYSGPAVLDLSHRAVAPLTRGEPSGGALTVNWTGATEAEWGAFLAREARSPRPVARVLQQHGVAKRLAEALCRDAGAADTDTANLSKRSRLKLLELLTRYVLPVEGHEGYKKAEVTGGGVSLRDVDCATGESRVLPGVYLCGEVLDVFGRIGGFNFYWAWVSGRAAGLAAGAAAVHRGDSASAGATGCVSR